MVAGGDERVGQPGQHPCAVVVHQARLAVQQLRSAVDDAAERHPQRLMPQADPQQRDFALGAVLDHRQAHAGVVGVPWAGREQDAVDTEPLDLAHLDVVVAPHDRLRAQLAEVLHEVVDERVVVVDDEDPGHATIVPGCQLLGRARESSTGPVNAGRRRPLDGVTERTRP